MGRNKDKAGGRLVAWVGASVKLVGGTHDQDFGWTAYDMILKYVVLYTLYYATLLLASCIWVLGAF